MTVCTASSIRRVFMPFEQAFYQSTRTGACASLASQDLRGFTLNEDKQELMPLWQMILQEARRTAYYDDQKKYGPYQIESELNTYREDIVGSQKRKIYDYPSLNSNLITLKVKLKAYYLKYIKDKLFEYQLLK